MLKLTDAIATLPAQDIKRARQFYEQKLGLVPTTEEADGGVRYKAGNSVFLVFPSRGKASGDHTQLGVDVDDINAAVTELKGNGVKIEEYDYPDFKTKGGIVEMPDGSKGAWFKDSEGNLIAVNQMARTAAGASSTGGQSTSR